MGNKTTLIGGAVAAAVIVVGAIAFLQGFDAEKIACEDIPEARASLQSTYEAGVNASVQVYAEERTNAEERLSQCLRAEPADPCASEQAARDAAYKAFFDIPSPPDNAPYADFQEYYKKRDYAYNNYKTAKAALDQCRAANPPKEDVPYEESDTKACFDAYDSSMASAQSRFDADTQTMRTAFRAAMAALDAREKACHPPAGDDKFTESIGVTGNGGVSIDVQSCVPLNPDADAELAALRGRAAALPAEIQSTQDSIDNIRKRMSPLQRDLSEVDTYIPPESTKTQFEGALNALRAERKVAIESTLEFYENMLARRQAEKTKLEEELRDIEAKIQARLDQIKRENEARQRNFPTAVRLAKPEPGGCDYYHCHGLICGRPDPAPEACGHGATTQEDTECKLFIDSYLKAAVNN